MSRDAASRARPRRRPSHDRAARRRCRCFARRARAAVRERGALRARGGAGPPLARAPRPARRSVPARRCRLRRRCAQSGARAPAGRPARARDQARRALRPIRPISAPRRHAPPEPTRAMCRPRSGRAAVSRGGRGPGPSSEPQQRRMNACGSQCEASSRCRRRASRAPARRRARSGAARRPKPARPSPGRGARAAGHARSARDHRVRDGRGVLPGRDARQRAGEADLRRPDVAGRRRRSGGRADRQVCGRRDRQGRQGGRRDAGAERPARRCSRGKTERQVARQERTAMRGRACSPPCRWR